MDYQRQTVRMLHDEHLRTIAALERLEAALVGSGTKVPAEGAMDEAERAIAPIIEGEVGPHFRFEEDELFPRLAEAGDGSIGELLAEEHEAILPLAARVLEQLRTARTDGFDRETWEAFRRDGLELVERMIAHIQKEEMALLMTLDGLLDEAADAELALSYAAQR
jgi:hemerythrin-like domain-containing protein